MAAPALVALAHGSRDPRSAATIGTLVDEVKAMRPDLTIEKAFLELSRPSFQTVVDRLVRKGHDEIVVVPLLLSEAYHAKVDVPRAVAEATARHEGLSIRSTDVLGLGTSLLDVLDLRMREALKASRVRELDALVLAAAGSSDALANQAVARLARLWGTRHKLPVTAAFASAAPPATGEARRASCPTGPASWRWRPARSPSPSRSAHTRSWPAPSWPGTPWARSSWSRSEPREGERARPSRRAKRLRSARLPRSAARRERRVSKPQQMRRAARPNPPAAPAGAPAGGPGRR